MGLTEFLESPALLARYQAVRRYSFLREAAYDVTSRCQLRCDGCYYFKNGKDLSADVRDPQRWSEFFSTEAERGINYANLAGAEPALAPAVLAEAAKVFKYGTVFTNGLRPISPDIHFRIHISVWGNEAQDQVYRPLASGRLGGDLLGKQLQNYRDDDRVILVYTFNGRNVAQADEVVQRIRDAGLRVTFNVFSAPELYQADLQTGDKLDHIGQEMSRLTEAYPDTVIYSHYNSLVHTSPHSLRSLFGCPYPRAAPAGRIGIGATFRSYRTDLSHGRSGDCCIPDTDCNDCRHYAAGSAIVTSALRAHVGSEAAFRGWLDYADVYLAVWTQDHRRGECLFLQTDAAEARRFLGASATSAAAHATKKSLPLLATRSARSSAQEA